MQLETLPENRYRFRCTDDGIGMSKDFIQHIGVDKFEASRMNQYFAVFMDMQMPVMDGYIAKPVAVKDIRSAIGEIKEA